MKRAGTRVVITGASSGIGAATALAFARRGARLVLAARGESGLDDIARRCRELGGEAQIRLVDVTDAAAVATFAAEAREVLGEIDLWFSDVGIGVVGRYQDVPLADHRQVVETNLVGHMNDAHAVLPIFLAQDHGIWVNMISIGGFLAAPYAAAYSASKFGLRGFSEALRAEVSDRPRIHVCDVYPIFVDTPGIAHAGNFTGAKPSYPPGALAPGKVADAIVALADRPRPTTVLGMPTLMLKLTQFLTPDLSATLMNAFMRRWAAHGERAPETHGTLFRSPDEASGLTSGEPLAALPTVAMIGGAVGLAALGLLLWRGSPRR